MFFFFQGTGEKGPNGYFRLHRAYRSPSKVENRGQDLKRLCTELKNKFNETQN